MLGNGCTVAESNQRNMQASRNLLRRVHDRMRPKRRREPSADEKGRYGLTIRVDPACRRRLAGPRPAPAGNDVRLALLAVSGFLFALAILLGLVRCCTHATSACLDVFSTFALMLVSIPYFLLPVLIPVLFFTFVFLSIRSTIPRATAQRPIFHRTRTRPLRIKPSPDPATHNPA